jgi:hypothetical protein
MTRDGATRGIGLLVMALMVLAAAGCIAESGDKKEVSSLAQVKVEEQIKRFRQGEKFSGTADDYVVNGQPDSEALGGFEAALKREKEPVREEIFRLLAAVGKRADSLYVEGGNMIRDRRIISMMVNDGLSRPGSVRDYCLGVLRASTPASSLKVHGRALAGNLRQWPDGVALLVIAKAKPPEAREVVDSLYEKTSWRDAKETAIARAALGDAETEERLTDDFLSTRDPQVKADQALILGYVGTEKTLSALAGEMRTSLVLEKPMVSIRSVRVFIVAALSYNFPDQPFLYDNAITSDEGYARVEKFCEETFGTKWTRERPPFLWIQGFPSGFEE